MRRSSPEPLTCKSGRWRTRIRPRRSTLGARRRRSLYPRRSTESRGSAEPRTGRVHGLGRRKTAVARVTCGPARGAGRSTADRFEDYFPRDAAAVGCAAARGHGDGGSLRRPGQRRRRRAPGRRTRSAWDSRAPSSRWTRSTARLRNEELLTRDAREVERKKPGRPKARKRFQFSKRSIRGPMGCRSRGGQWRDRRSKGVR
jgi:small subunit ribosomal protein S9